MYLRDSLRLPAKGLSPSALPIFHQPDRCPSLSGVYLHRFAQTKKPQPLPVGVLVLRLFYVRPYSLGHQTSPGNAGARKPVKVVARQGHLPALHDVQCYTPWLVMSITMGAPKGPRHCHSGESVEHNGGLEEGMLRFRSCHEPHGSATAPSYAPRAGASSICSMPLALRLAAPRRYMLDSSSAAFSVLIRTSALMHCVWASGTVISWLHMRAT